jgi:predicted RNA binding protein YcfA (HicA-like mRNA interferase family)
MPKIKPLSFEELLQKLRALGFVGPYSGGKHRFMIKDQMRLTLPNPHKREIGVDLIRRLMRQGQITREEWDEK